MLTYRQKTGEILRDGKLLAKGYAGFDDGDGIRNVGPVPVGRYQVTRPFVHPTAGSFVMRLLPLPGTQTFGRSGFLIHGDSRKNPGAGSHGCIVLSRADRELVWATGERILEVVADAPAASSGGIA
jgi:hypothetical protein